MTRTLPALPLALAPDPEDQIAVLAARWKRANGPVMSLVTRLGGTLESQIRHVPATTRAHLEAITTRALETAYGLSARGTRLPDPKGRITLAAALATGAAGGAGGLATALAELPLTITLLLQVIRREAAAAGYDPEDPWIKAEALRCFGSGSPTSADDGIDTSFLSARLTLTGPALQRLIASVTPKLAAALGQKLAAQTVPILGAVSGAALNAAFLRYYREAAAIRFALLRLAEQHGAEPVLTAFEQATRSPRIIRS